MLDRISPFVVGNTELTEVNSLEFTIDHNIAKSSFYQVNPPVPIFSNVTITIANPCVVTWTAHGLTTGSAVQFTTTNSLPTGVIIRAIYFARVIDVNSFHIYDTQANATNLASTVGRVITTGTQNGTHTCARNANKKINIGFINQFETIALIFNSTNPINTISFDLGTSGYIIRWANQTQPIMTTLANRKDVITLLRIGNEIFGSYILNT